jgi:hypothetical protein
MQPNRFVDRREFLKTTISAVPLVGAAAATAATKTTQQDSETLVTTLYKSLTPEQRSVVCMPFDHPLRSKVDNAWYITPKKIDELFNRDQQAMITEIFRGLHNPDFVDKVMYHVKEDAGGLDKYSVALFGEPGTGKFEFVLAGRHCTARCDGDSVEGAAFGGPIFYGHQSGESGMEKPDHPNNVYWYQSKRANEVFAALNGKQREIALVSTAPRAEKATETVTLASRGQTAGLPVSDMTRDQQELVGKVLGDLLLPFRKKDTDEAMRLIKANGGVNALSMAFFKNLDLGKDGIWDVWQLESPKMVWYFRGHPHVHVWVNIKA